MEEPMLIMLAAVRSELMGSQSSGPIILHERLPPCLGISESASGPGKESFSKIVDREVASLRCECHRVEFSGLSRTVPVTAMPHQNKMNSLHHANYSLQS